MTESEGDRPLSEAAEAMDNHGRGLITDLTDFKVRKPEGKKRRPWQVTLLFVVFLLVAIGFLLLLITRPEWITSQSEPLNASGTESTVTDQSAASSGPISDTAGPISGTWAMYWTNDDDKESLAFTIAFKGTDTGTLEILEDTTVSKTSFTIEGDKVEFEFTRAMTTAIDTVLEEDSFLGTLTGADFIVGEWGRQDWECWPDPNAGCRTTPNWYWYPSRLIRISE